MKKISLIAFIAMMFCLTSLVKGDHQPNQPQRVRRPIRINIGGINIEIGRKRNGRRGVKVDVPQAGVHVDVDSNKVRNGAGGVHVTSRGIVYWGQGFIPVAPQAPPMPQPATKSNVELGQPAGSDKPFDLDTPVKKKIESSVPPAPSIN